jgi:hypothetical protein
MRSQPIVRRKIKRNLEPFDRRFGVSLVEIDPAAAAPGPRRAAIDRQRLANDHLGRIQVLHQGESIAKDREHRGVAGKGLGLAGQIQTADAILVRIFCQVIDDALSMRPRGQRGRERIVGVAFPGTLQQLERARIALRVERKHAGHRPERQIVNAQINIRLPQGAVDFGNTQGRPKRRDQLGGQVFRGNRVAAGRAIGAVRPEITSCLGLDQSKGQAGLPIQSAKRAGQGILRRTRPTCDRNSGARQRGRKLVGDVAGGLGVLGRGVDRKQGDFHSVAAERNERSF